MGLGSRPGHLVVSSEYQTEVDNSQRSSFKTSEIAVCKASRFHTRSAEFTYNPTTSLSEHHMVLLIGVVVVFL